MSPWPPLSVTFFGSCMNRPLGASEKHLVRWLLEHGGQEARALLPVLEKAGASDWHCACGCASINFSIKGVAKPSGGIRPIADFVFGSDQDLSGIFVFEQSGVLAGLEVYGMAGDAPKTLPLPESLRSWSDGKRCT